MKKYSKEWYICKKIDWSLYTSKQKEQIIEYVQKVGHTVIPVVRNSRFIYFWANYRCAYSDGATCNYFDKNYKIKLLPKDLFPNIQSKLK